MLIGMSPMLSTLKLVHSTNAVRRPESGALPPNLLNSAGRLRLKVSVLQQVTLSRKNENVG